MHRFFWIFFVPIILTVQRVLGSVAKTVKLSKFQSTSANGVLAAKHHGTLSRSNRLTCPPPSSPNPCDRKRDVAVAILPTQNTKAHSLHDGGHRSVGFCHLRPSNESSKLMMLSCEPMSGSEQENWIPFMT
jgi:hypothetical protein